MFNAQYRASSFQRRKKTKSFFSFFLKKQNQLPENCGKNIFHLFPFSFKVVDIITIESSLKFPTPKTRERKTPQTSQIL